MLRSALLSVLLLAPPLLASAQTGVLPPPAPTAQPHPVLDRIRAAQSLNCGLAKEEEDYSRAEDHGNRAAFDIDMCKAIAVAVLGPGARFNMKIYPDEPAAVNALLSGAIDLLASASPSVANTAKGLLFTHPTFYDGQGFLLPNNPAVHTPLDLAGKRICFLTGSVAESGLHSYAEQHGISYIWYPFSEAGEMEAAFFTGNCDAISSDVSQLANIRAIERQRIAAFTILPQLIRQDPLAAATLAADPRFSAVANWTVATLIEGEELGVNQNNVAAQLVETRPEISSAHPEPRLGLQQLLGQRYGTGTMLGLDPHWSANIIHAVGNYGEVFARDLGANSPLHLDRGQNRLWMDGGLMFTMPLTDR